MDSSSDNSTEAATPYESQQIRNIKFGVFVALEPPALICNFILIYYLIVSRTLRHTLHYHAILILLIVTLLTNLIQVPRIIHFLHIGTVIPQTIINCLIWLWSDYTLYSILNIYMFWISTERYLLIFHADLYTSSRRRLLLHYIPSIAIIIYVCLFFIIVIFFYPCEPYIDFSEPLCGFACYTMFKNITLYDFLAHAAVPMILGMLIDIILVVRVIFRKRVGLNHQGAQWRKHRKMMIQLLTISGLYLFLQIPCTTVVFVQLFVTLPEWAAYIQIVYFYYFFWLLTLLLPFACFACMTDISKKLKDSIIKITQYRRQNMIVAPGNTAQPQNRTYMK